MNDKEINKIIVGGLIFFLTCNFIVDYFEGKRISKAIELASPPEYADTNIVERDLYSLLYEQGLILKCVEYEKIETAKFNLTCRYTFLDFWSSTMKEVIENQISENSYCEHYGYDGLIDILNKEVIIDIKNGDCIRYDVVKE